MAQQHRSIEEHIECLARLTGAPLSFVDQVRLLFRSKGISLESEVAPFVEALDEAFRREENIRCTAQQARRNLVHLDRNFEQVGKAYVAQHSKPKRAAAATRAQDRARSGSGVTQVTIRAGHRAFVTRTVREDQPLVPGPQDLQ